LQTLTTPQLFQLFQLFLNTFVNNFNGIVVYIPTKSLNKEEFSTPEYEEENKERKRSDD